MQKLIFEESWDRTISDTDRFRIKKAFQETVLSDLPAVQFSPLWEAMNHKGELLASVIIHNKSGESFSFTNQTVIYKTEEKTLAKHKFSLPFTVVKARTSMPWTFIFPSESIVFDHKLEGGNLELTNSYDPD